MAIVTKAAIHKLCDEHMLNSNEIEPAIEFVRDLMEMAIAELKFAEPYATHSIREMERAAYHIIDLKDTVEGAK